MAQIEIGLRRSLSQAPPGPGWAGKRPKIDDIRFYAPPPEETKKTCDCIGFNNMILEFGIGGGPLEASWRRPLAIQ